MDPIFSIHKDRLITNNDIDEGIKSYLADLGIDVMKNKLFISSGKLLIIDPQYLAEDIYFEESPKARYLIDHGIILNDFGGDFDGPILKTLDGGIKIILAYDKQDDEGNFVTYNSEYYNKLLGSREIDNTNFGCDGGSFIFLDFTEELQQVFSSEFSFIEFSRLFILYLEKKDYCICYEQWEPSRNNPQIECNRNIVIFPDNA